MKLDMHCHSSYSPDSDFSVEDVLAHAKRIGLDGVVVTDHNQIKGSLKAYEKAKDMNLVVIRGTEISSCDGHILAYGISETVPRGLSASETLEHIGKLGGVAVAAHPFRWYTGLKKRTILSNKFSVFEANNGRSLNSTNTKVERLANRIGKGVTGGSDAHGPSELGSATTIFNEHIDKEDDILAAILKRRTKVNGDGRSMRASIRYARKCVTEWFGRGMRRI